MIDTRYTLFNRIPLWRGADGTYRTDALWAKDILLHLQYLSDFNICCPVITRPEGDGTPLPGLDENRVFALRQDKGWGSVAANLIPNFRRVLRAARHGGILHSGGAGWAFPLSYYLLLLRPFVRFEWVMVIESTFWMAPTDRPAGPKARLSEAFHRFAIRRCLRSANARIFTQDWYRDLLLPGTTERSLIAPAAWIDEEIIRPVAAEPRPPGPTRLIYPTRLTSEKGVATVLEAVSLLAARADAPPLVLDVIGEGPMKDAVLAAVGRLPDGPVRIRFLDPVPYGAPFFELLRGYDGVLIANRTEEQPRIAFDAFSQGLPCVASRTHGNTSVIEDGRTGLFFAPGDAPALADLLARLAADATPLAAMREAALATAQTQTHQGMHRRREVFLREVLEPS